MVHYQFLKHLPFTSLSILLDILNDVWQSVDFPSSWKEALVIPIPKPGKDSSDPNNDRPIALTSCHCKTLERMVNTRLVWFWERNNLIVEVQSGFRRQRDGWSPCPLRNVYSRSIYKQTTCSVCILWSWKCVWHNLELRNFKGLVWLWSQRPSSHFHRVLFKWTAFSSTCW